VLHEAPGDLIVQDVLVDAPAPHEVLITTKATGLCHSDLHIMRGDRPAKLPVVLGHEAAGIVETVGERVTSVAPADRVVVFPVGACGRCDRCLSGRPTLCTSARLHRTESAPPRLRLADGGECGQFGGLATFAEKMLVHEDAVAKVGDNIPFASAALLGCAVSTGLGAVMRRARVQPGETVAVVGCGGVGLNCVQGAAIVGARRVIAIDTNAGKLNYATTFGATDLVDASRVDPVMAVTEILADHGGVDHAFEAVGTPETYQLAFKLLRRGGTATLVGVVSPGDVVTLSANDFLGEKQIQGTLLGSIRFREDIPYFADLYADGRLKLDELVSSRIGLDEINEGYAQITDGGIARSVVVFE
jgi:S-(hydroxymethyl)glutathione dehydrogenase/alcohol dehydrogenase